MMEHIVLHHLNSTLNSILHNRQHGFRRGLSCETQLCLTYNDILKLTESSSAVSAVVLEFKNAFDKAPHRQLVDKLKSLPNVDPRIVNWIQDFLTSRNQQVVVENSESITLAVTSEIPQGSVLGPTLFFYIHQ